MTDYPLIKKLGLEVIPLDYPKGGYGWTHGVAADDLERVLREAPIKYGRIDGDFGWRDKEDYAGEHKKTHTARLLLVEPIQKDTADSVLKELVSAIDTAGIIEYRPIFVGSLADIVAKARKFLEQK